jgi:Zn2+/Cd2+-exporting ATPase
MALSFTEMWQDKKFRLLFGGVVLVGVFEVLSLTGVELPHIVAFPLFLGIILLIGHKTIKAGFMALAKLNFKSISLLMVIAVIGAFFLGEYEEAAIVIVLFTLGEYLEDFGIQASRSALQSLVERVPKTAKVKGNSIEVPIEQLKLGDIVVVQPSDMIPVDGSVTSGQSSVDESTITGEPIPKDKHEGDPVFAGTLNVHGYMEIQVTKIAKDSTLSKIIDLTFNAGKTKAETQKFIERFSRVYTPAILVIVTLLIAVPTLFLDQPFEKWFREGLTLLVIACPCALVISTPVSIYSAIGNASGKGVVIKGGKFIEEIGRIRAIALDKTRTITEGKPVVSDIIPFGETTREHLLACAAGIEQYSEHPLAVSVLEAAEQEGIKPHAVERFQSVFGKGATAECLVCYDRAHAIGKLKFISEQVDVQKAVVDTVDQLQAAGKTAMVISAGNTIEGVIAVTDSRVRS